MDELTFISVPTRLPFSMHVSRRGPRVERMAAKYVHDKLTGRINQEEITANTRVSFCRRKVEFLI